MKSKYLFYAVAASLAFASCSNEEFGYGENGAPEGDMVSMDGVNLLFTRSGADEQTRAEWTEKTDKTGIEFSWTSQEDAIGMVYTGQGGTTGVTNYRFAADSLKLNESYVKVKQNFDKTKSTSLFYEINKDNNYSSVTLGTTTGYENYELIDKNKDTEFKATLGRSSAAKFKTEQDYILKGYYVAYYPHDVEYKNAGELIPVRSPKEITVGETEATPVLKTTAEVDNKQVAAENLKEVGKHTFSYSAPAEVKAGRQITEFSLKNLSSALRIKIANEGGIGAVDKSIKTVVLRTKGNDAFVVKGTLPNPSAKPAASAIAVDEKDGKTATLFVRYAENYMLKLAAQKTKTDKDTLEVYFPVLPVTLAEGGIEVILIGDDNMACVLNAEFKNKETTLSAGRRINLNVKVDETTKFDQSFVTSPQELQDAINSAKGLTSPTTINLLGDIESVDDTNPFTMKGTDAKDWEGGVTIVASRGSKLTLKNPTIEIHNDDAADKSVWLTIDAPLAIEGGTILGSVALNGETTIGGKLNLGKANSNTDFYSGQLLVGGNTTVKAEATVDAIYSKGVTVKKGANLTIAKSGEKSGKFINNNWDFDGNGNEKQYKSDLIIEGTMTVDGVLEDNGDTQINGGKLVINGTATNINTLNAKNGTIEVNGKFTNELGTTATNKINNPGNIKIETGALTVNDGGEIYNKSSLNCMGAFVNNGTFYDYVGSVYGGNPYTSNGAYACYVDSEQRLEEAYKRLDRYAKDKFQKIILQPLKSGKYYDLSNINAAKVNFENDGEVTIGDNDEGKEPTKYSINSLKVNNNSMTVKGDLVVAGETKGGQTVAPLTVKKGATVTFENNITVSLYGEIVNEGTFNLQNAKQGQLPATVYCTKADVTKGAWTNYPIVIADGSF